MHPHVICRVILKCISEFKQVRKTAQRLRHCACETYVKDFQRYQLIHSTKYAIRREKHHLSLCHNREQLHSTGVLESVIVALEVVAAGALLFCS